MDLLSRCAASLALLLACSQPPEAADLAPGSADLGSGPPADLSLTPAMDLRPAQRAVVVIGSSTAAGTGASSAARAWVGLLTAAAAARCPLTKVTNLGRGGYTTWHAMPVAAPRPAGRPASDPARNLEAALALRPDLVLIQFPSNDAAAKLPLAETLGNHGVLRDGVRAAGASEAIVGPFPRAFTEAAQIALMTGLRDQLPSVGGSRYVPLWNALADSDSAVRAEYAAGDGVHLNDRGHQLVADAVLASAAWRAVCPPP